MKETRRAWLVPLLFWALGNAAPVAGGENAAWPPLGPLPKTLDKSAAAPRYGKPVRVFSAKQRQALWKARVRKDHPRLYFTKETLPKLRERMKTHPAYPHIQKQAEAGNLLASAFVFQISGNRKYARTALSVFTGDAWLKKGVHLDAYRAALIFDWCFSAIPAEDYEELVKNIASFLPDEKTDKGANGPKKFQPDRWGSFPKPDLGLTHLYLALAHHWPGAEVDAMNFFHPDGSPMGEVLGLDAFSRDGSFIPHDHGAWRTDVVTKNRFAFNSATGIETLNEKEWGLNFNNRLYSFLYNAELAGGHELEYFYGISGKPPVALRNNARMGLHLLNAAARNPHYQWFLHHVIYPKGLVETFRNDPLRLIELALWWDPGVPEKRPDDLPRGRFLAPGVWQNATFRSGFKGKGDTIAIFLFSDSWDGDSIGGAHFGSFKLFKDEYLAAPTANGPFWRTTYGYNNVAFFDTSTRASKGHDRPVHPRFGSVYTFAKDFVPRYPANVEGTVRAFESRPEYDYVGFANEPTFYPKEMLKEWSGQAVFLRPGVLVRFDRVEVAEQKYQPRFFLWMTGEQPKVSGKVVRSIIAGHVEDYDGDEASWLGHLHQSKLHFKALLPKAKRLRLAYGNLGGASSDSLLSKTRRKAIGAMGRGPGKKQSGRLILKMKHKTPAGSQILPALAVGPAPQRRTGNFTLRVKGGALRITQTAAGKDEDLPFYTYPTLLDLVKVINGLGFWAYVAANYEHWVEGNIFHRALLETAQQPPYYDNEGRLSPKRRQAILKGDPGRRSDILNPRAAGHLEVRLPGLEAGPRTYFLNVITATDAAGKNPVIPASTLEEDGGTVTAVLKWAGEEVRVTFHKKGALGGHIKITKGGRVSVDRDLAQKLELGNQAFGADFLNGKRK